MRKARILLMTATILATIVVPARATFPGKNGRVVFAGDEVRTPEGCSYGTPDLYTMSANGDNIRNLTKSEDAESRPVWSPDGRKLAFSASSVDSGEEGSEIHVMKKDGTGETAIVLGGYNDHPTWSDHGQWVAYASTVEAEHDILRTRSDGSRTETVIGTSADETMPSYAPDGERIAYVWNSNEIRSVRPDGTKVRRVTGEITNVGGFSNLGWSPDGGWIIFTMNKGERDSFIYRIRRNGTRMSRVARGRDPAWSPNGKTILFQAASGEHDTLKGCTEELFRMDPDGSNKRQIPKRDGQQMLFLDWQAR